MEQQKLKTLINAGTIDYSSEIEAAALALGLNVGRQSTQLVLKTPVELLNRAQIAEYLPHDSELEIFWSLDSTNSYLMEKMSVPFPGYRICLAEQQLAGRGRRGRTWVSPFGSNLYMSVARMFSRSVTDLGGLSLVVGMQVVETLRSGGVDHVGLKWPNDIILNDGKVAGILVEVGSVIEAEIPVVVGIGVNTWLSERDRDRIDQAFSTLGEKVNKNELAGRILSGVTRALEEFGQLGFSSFHERWAEFNVYAGKDVVVHLGDSIIHGRDLGVDAAGNLLLDTSGGVRSFNAGEVSLRPGTD